jgi:hypothetical protein
LSFDNSHNELQLYQLLSNDDDRLREESLMIKRILVIALAAALLAGCGTQEAASAGKTTDRDAAVQTARETDPAFTPQTASVMGNIGDGKCRR